MKNFRIGVTTICALLLASAVVSHTAAKRASAVPTFCSTPVQATCTVYDEYDFPSIAAHSSAEISITVSGTEFGDEVIVTPVGSPETGLLWGGCVGNVDTVKLRLVNVTGSAIDPAERKYRTTVNKY